MFLSSVCDEDGKPVSRLWQQRLAYTELSTLVKTLTFLEDLDKGRVIELAVL